MNRAREGEERGRGIPRTEEERQSRHEDLYPGTPLPERGTGLSTELETPYVGASLLGLVVIVGIAFMVTRKKV